MSVRTSLIILAPAVYCLYKKCSKKMLYINHGGFELLGGEKQILL